MLLYKRYYIFLYFIISFNAHFIFCELSCKNEKGENVDWYIVYKIPKLDSDNDLVNEGVAHIFWGPSSSDWQFPTFGINSSISSISQTLLPLYKNQTSQLTFNLMYNDEHLDGTVTLVQGHTKGVVAFDSTSGFWLIHSVPKFPPPSNQSYIFTDSGLVYGQSFICISLSFSSANAIGGLLLYDTPFIYDYYISDSIRNKIPLLDAVVHNKHVTQRPWNSTIVLHSMANFPFQVFAKHKDYDKDIYSSWVAPFFQTNLLTETWQNGPSKLASSCSSSFTVENIKQLTIALAKVTFKSTHDHSKIALSKQSDKPWICIGDINRMDAQKRRGGGTTCLKNQLLWKSFFNLVTNIESCNKTINRYIYEVNII